VNEKSVICKFIRDNPNNWEELMEREYHVTVKKSDSYAIFNYSFNCDYTKPVVQEARGIIIDFEKLEVVCWPFRKFGNHNESYADEIDWESARVLEKVDGSIIKLWYDKRLGDWQFSTNGTIRAQNAPLNSVTAFADAMSFMSVIRQADNYGDIPFDKLDRDVTYIFELVSPLTQIVIDYGATTLYHIGTRSNITGEEFECDIGIKKPASYPIGSLAECVEAALRLNSDTNGVIEGEGFVVVDKHYNRVKVKSPDYLVMNKLTQTKTVSKRECVELLLKHSPDVEIMCSSNRDLLPIFKYYEFKLAELAYLANKIAILARGMLREYDGNRGAVAKLITKHPLYDVGFMAIEREGTGEELLFSRPIKNIIKFIPDYTPEDVAESIFSKHE